MSRPRRSTARLLRAITEWNELDLVVMSINTMTFVAPNLACGEARGGRIPGHGAVTDEQRSHRPNSAQPGGRQVFFAQTSLLAPHRSTAGYARRSRLVCAKNPWPRTSSYLCLRPLRLRFVPKGPCDNSPAFQRWGPR